VEAPGAEAAGAADGGAAAGSAHSLRRVIDLMMEVIWLVLLFVLPLVFFPDIFTTFELAKVTVFLGGTTLLVLLWAAKYLWLGESLAVEWRIHKFLWYSLGIFLVCYALAAVTSFAPALSFLGSYPRFQGVVTFAGYLLFGTVLFFEANTDAKKERLVLAVMAGFIFVCGTALLQKFLPGFLQWWNDAEFNGRIYGTLANPNYLAAYIVMVMPLLLGNFFRKKYRLFSALAFVLGAAALLYTLSREGFLAFLVSLLFFLLIVAIFKKAKKTIAGLVLIPLLAAGFVGYVITHQQESWVQNTPFIQRLTTDGDNVSSAQTRLEIWGATLKQIAASPLLGFGPETFAVTFPQFAPATVNTREDQGEIADHAHNELLDFGAQIGIPGAIAYLCFIGALIFLGTVFFFRNAGGSGENNRTDAAAGISGAAAKSAAAGAGTLPIGESATSVWLALSLSSGILGLFVANEFGFSVTVTWVMLTVFAAMLLNILHRQHLTAMQFQLGPVSKIIIFVIVAALSLGIFWIHNVRLVLADAQMRQGYDALVAQNDLATTAQQYRIAAGLAPDEAFYSLNFAYTILQREYNGETLPAALEIEAIDRAFHASRLRGYDDFSVSVVVQLKKISGLTF
jgi:O-antigen ligase